MFATRLHGSAVRQAADTTSTRPEGRFSTNFGVEPQSLTQRISQSLRQALDPSMSANCSTLLVKILGSAFIHFGLCRQHTSNCTITEIILRRDFALVKHNASENRGSLYLRRHRKTREIIGVLETDNKHTFTSLWNAKPCRIQQHVRHIVAASPQRIQNDGEGLSLVSRQNTLNIFADKRTRLMISQKAAGLLSELALQLSTQSIRANPRASQGQCNLSIEKNAQSLCTATYVVPST